MKKRKKEKAIRQQLKHKDMKFYFISFTHNNSIDVLRKTHNHEKQNKKNLTNFRIRFDTVRSDPVSECQRHTRRK